MTELVHEPGGIPTLAITDASASQGIQFLSEEEVWSSPNLPRPPNSTLSSSALGYKRSLYVRERARSVSDVLEQPYLGLPDKSQLYNVSLSLPSGPAPSSSGLTLPSSGPAPSSASASASSSTLRARTSLTPSALESGRRPSLDSISTTSTTPLLSSAIHVGAGPSGYSTIAIPIAISNPSIPTASPAALRSAVRAHLLGLFLTVTSGVPFFLLGIFSWSNNPVVLTGSWIGYGVLGWFLGVVLDLFSQIWLMCLSPCFSYFLPSDGTTTVADFRRRLDLHVTGASLEIARCIVVRWFVGGFVDAASFSLAFNIGLGFGVSFSCAAALLQAALLIMAAAGTPLDLRGEERKPEEGMGPWTLGLSTVAAYAQGIALAVFYAWRWEMIVAGIAMGIVGAEVGDRLANEGAGGCARATALQAVTAGWLFIGALALMG